MYRNEYFASRELVSKANSLPANAFYSLIMAAMREAGTDEGELLRIAFPDVFRELKARHNAPGGLLEGEIGEIIC
jgi:hypothetical protein